MKTAIEPKSNDITITDFKSFYEISFEDGKALLMLSREEMIMLRNRITEVLKEDDKDIEMIRETEEFKSEVEGDWKVE